MGEGGCLVTNDKKILEKVKRYRSLGVTNESELRYKKREDGITMLGVKVEISHE